MSGFLWVLFFSWVFTMGVVIVTTELSSSDIQDSAWGPGARQARCLFQGLDGNQSWECFELLPGSTSSARCCSVLL